jgi:hypothetical protein
MQCRAIRLSSLRCRMAQGKTIQPNCCVITTYIELSNNDKATTTPVKAAKHRKLVLQVKQLPFFWSTISCRLAENDIIGDDIVNGAIPISKAHSIHCMIYKDSPRMEIRGPWSVGGSHSIMVYTSN